MARQPNGRSSIRKGADGRWHTWVTVGFRPDGSPIQRHVSAKTAAEVAGKVAELAERVEVGTSTKTKTETLAQWLGYWLTEIVKPQRAYKTHQGYELICRRHIIPRIGGYRLAGLKDRLEPEHVQRLYTDLGKRTEDGGAGLAPSYVVQVDRVLSRALTVAVRHGRATRNVCDLIDPPTARRVKIRALGLADAQAVIRAAAADEMAPRWLVAVLLGLRQGEVLGMRWSYLDLETATLEVPRQIQRRTWQHGCDDPRACARPHCEAAAARCGPSWAHGCGKGRGCRAYRQPRTCPQRVQVPCKRHPNGCPPPCPPDCAKHASLCPQRRDGGLVDAPTKSATGEGEPLPLDDTTVDLLRAQRERQIRDEVFDPGGLVFTNAEGRPVDPAADRRAWRALLDRAGVADTRLHAARHTAGTLLMATGTNPAVVKDVLRHAQISTTMVYVHPGADLKREAVDRVAAALIDGDLAALLRPTTPPAHRKGSRRDV